MITLCKSGLLTNHVFTIVSKSESLDKNLMTCISSSYFGFDLLKLKYEEEHDQKKNMKKKKIRPTILSVSAWIFYWTEFGSMKWTV